MDLKSQLTRNPNLLHEQENGWTLLGRTIFNISSKEPHPSQFLRHKDQIMTLVEEGSLYMGKMYDVNCFRLAIKAGLRLRRLSLEKSMFPYPILTKEQEELAFRLAEYSAMTVTTWFP